MCMSLKLLHILILHQTTTTSVTGFSLAGCFIFWFYIKPQPLPACAVLPFVASYFDSTSNHNNNVLHRYGREGCFIFWFYIKPQHSISFGKKSPSCFIFWFYIKPQLNLHIVQHGFVASYFDSTSNHNGKSFLSQCLSVASYFDSTSNHNTKGGGGGTMFCCFIFWFYIKPQRSSYINSISSVASYFDSTSNHNMQRMQ